MRYAVLALLQIVCIAGFAQTLVQGNTTVQGIVQVNSQFSRNVQIMALFPPNYNSGSDYTNFRNNVMSQPSVDGATLEILWSTVEQMPPSSSSCGSISDTCQLDAVGQYHTYSWADYDSNVSPTYPNSVVPWFDTFGGVRKKVNLILTGINTGGINTATPWYVTSSTYVGNFTSPYNRQDVLNSIICSGSPWSGQTGASYSRTGTLVTVTLTNCCGTGPTQLHNGDNIWVTAPANTIGASAVPITTGTGSFTYNTVLSGPYTCTTQCTYIGTSQSSPVPYEEPYTVAWEAFLAAANLHFSPSYSPQGSNLGPQLGYVRSGTWVGGESYAYCTGTLNNPIYYPYQYMSSATWTGDYQNKVKYVESLAPTMTRYWPIDPGTDPDTMAQYAISAANGHGFINGFGSQGLSASDAASCAGANADWCTLFGDYHSLGVPLQLQQISISDETQNCVPASNCGPPPKSAGNLGIWLPFAVTHYATVFEVYYLDLALAFDTQYCTTLSTGTCMSGATCTAGYNPNPAFMTTTQQATWACDVGLLNSSCPSGSSCYATYINSNHGPM